MMTIQPAPASLIDEKGRPNMGIFESPIGNLNYLDFKPSGSGKRVSANRIKRWEYIGILSEDYIIGGAVVSLRFLCNAFFYLFDRKRRALREFNFIAPFCRGVTFDSNGISGRVTWERGGNRIAMENDRESGRHFLEVSVSGLRLEAELEDVSQAMVCSSRVGYRGFNYTVKLAGLPSRVHLKLDGVDRILPPEDTRGVIDYTTGCLARETFWNWASGGGRDLEGNVVGINFVTGVNETGVTENAFWVGDRMVKVDTVCFEYDGTDILAPWHIRSWDGRVDLKFLPEGQRFETLNFVLLASKFHQPFGRFQGVLVDDADQEHRIDALDGYTEEHYAKW